MEMIPPPYSYPPRLPASHFHIPNGILDLQTTYSNYKNTLQQIASKIGDIEQEAEEHKFVPFLRSLFIHFQFFLSFFMLRL
jgi:hypothetical protein